MLKSSTQYICTLHVTMIASPAWRRHRSPSSTISLYAHQSEGPSRSTSRSATVTKEKTLKTDYYWRTHSYLNSKKKFTTVVRLPIYANNYSAVTMAGTMVNSLTDTGSVSSIFSYIDTYTWDVSRRSDIGDVDIVLYWNRWNTPAIILLAPETNAVSFC